MTAIRLDPDQPDAATIDAAPVGSRLIYTWGHTTLVYDRDMVDGHIVWRDTDDRYLIYHSSSLTGPFTIPPHRLTLHQPSPIRVEPIRVERGPAGRTELTWLWVCACGAWRCDYYDSASAATDHGRAHLSSAHTEAGDPS